MYLSRKMVLAASTLLLFSLYSSCVYAFTLRSAVEISFGFNQSNWGFTNADSMARVSDDVYASPIYQEVKNSGSLTTAAVASSPYSSVPGEAYAYSMASVNSDKFNDVPPTLFSESLLNFSDTIPKDGELSAESIANVELFFLPTSLPFQITASNIEQLIFEQNGDSNNIESYTAELEIGYRVLTLNGMPVTNSITGKRVGGTFLFEQIDSTNNSGQTSGQNIELAFDTLDIDGIPIFTPYFLEIFARTSVSAKATAPTPEPSTIALLFAGLGCGLVLRKKRKRD